MGLGGKGRRGMPSKSTFTRSKITSYMASKSAEALPRLRNLEMEVQLDCEFSASR